MLTSWLSHGIVLSDLIGLDWTGFDPKSTPYTEEAVELQDSNMAPDQIYTINSKS